MYTDNNPLSHLQSAKLGAAEHRWAAALVAFDFEIKYRSGHSNRNTDALLRLYVPVVSSALSLPGTLVPNSIHQSPRLDSAVVAHQSLVSVLPSHSAAHLHSTQKGDSLLKEVLVFWRRGSLPTSIERWRLAKSAMALLRQWDCLVEEDGVLFCWVFSSDRGEEFYQLLLPTALKQETKEHLVKINCTCGPPDPVSNSQTAVFRLWC